ncbi:SERTA domain-containing protein 3, partial [Marasmius crinis-equi]
NWSKHGREKWATSLRIPEEMTYNELRTQWWCYWSNISLEWQQRDGDRIILDQNDMKGDWSNLNSSGKDGLALLLVFLWWWHGLIPATTEAKSEWLKALENIYFMYLCIYTQA